MPSVTLQNLLYDISQIAISFDKMDASECGRLWWGNGGAGNLLQAVCRLAAHTGQV